MRSHWRLQEQGSDSSTMVKELSGRGVGKGSGGKQAGPSLGRGHRDERRTHFSSPSARAVTGFLGPMSLLGHS